MFGTTFLKRDYLTCVNYQPEEAETQQNVNQFITIPAFEEVER